MFGHQGARHAEQRLGLLPEETGRDDLLLERGLLRARKRARVRLLVVACGRDVVDASVRRLRGENRRDEQLERVAIVKLGVCVRVLRCERLDDSADGVGRLQWIGPPLDQPTFEYVSEKTRM
jgi:hypothetical protein